ncbi:MAG TPA: hypothetical protein VF363_06620 [Candidatus Eisenbacteria bacterium]
MASRATAARSLAAALLVAALAVLAAGARGAAPDSTAADSAAAPAPPPVAAGAAAAPADWDTLAAGLPEQVIFGFAPRLAYDRADGPLLGGDAGFRRRKDVASLVHAWAGYAVSRERGLGGAGFEIPLGYRGVFRIGAEVYRTTATPDDWIVGRTENTFFALFARTDYMDWYEAEGGEARLRWNPGRDAAFSIRARIESQSSLRTRTRVALFGKDDRFRPMPPLQDGDLGAWTVDARVGPETLPPRGGTNGTIAFERAGDPIARDFVYSRLSAAVRTLIRLSPHQTIRARALVGSTREGSLPPQAVWHVGGIGTLRALDYKAFGGDQYFLANAEYYLLARKNLYPMAFLDWGAAWFGRDNLSRQKPALDGGVGLRLGEGPLLFTLGRDLGRSSAPLRFGVRLGGTF